MSDNFRTIGLFAGIGGLELGLEAAGGTTVGLCEIESSAQVVLKKTWGEVPLWDDVRGLKRIPRADVLTAGFPCQDLSQAGRKAGITGSQSSLVEHVLRLMANRNAPKTLILENVSYMLRLDSGRGMAYLTSALEELGLRWAYRVVDARSFGIPQRRQRVLLVASKTADPKQILLADDEGAAFNTRDTVGQIVKSSYYGFYWTEGLRGLGWAREAVPTVKGGSALGIPSPPAIWIPGRKFVGTPTIRDAERLQGFAPDWTLPATEEGYKEGARWKLVGNAVCVPMAEWLGHRLVSPSESKVQGQEFRGAKWPLAAYGERGHRFSVDVSIFPRKPLYKLSSFLEDDLRPLSVKATRGFLERAHRGKLRFSDGFLDSLELHAQRILEKSK
jgi:DNA (cytosine-5)-methyltransferase 1